MKKLIFLLCLLTTLALPYACESHHGEDEIQRQEQKETLGTQPVTFPDKGGNAGNK